jgi:hypothetical protein
MKPLTARTLVASHRSPDEDGRSMRPATIGKKNRLAALAAPAPIGGIHSERRGITLFRADG